MWHCHAALHQRVIAFVCSRSKDCFQGVCSTTYVAAHRVSLCPSVTLSQRDALELDVVRFRPPSAPCAWLPRAPAHPLVLIHTRSLPGCGRLTPPSVVTQECPVMLAVRGWYSGGLYGLTRKRKDPPHPTAPSSRGLLGCGCVRGPGAAVWRLWQWC